MYFCRKIPAIRRPGWPPRVVGGPAGGFGGRGCSRHVRLADGLAPKQCPQHRAAHRNRRIPGRSACLGLLSLQPLIGTSDLLLDRLQLGRILGPQCFDFLIALFTRCLHQPKPELSLGFCRPGQLLERRTRPQLQCPLAVKIVLQCLGPLGIALGSGKLARQTLRSEPRARVPCPALAQQSSNGSLSLQTSAGNPSSIRRTRASVSHWSMPAFLSA